MSYSVLLIDNEPLIVEGLRILVSMYLDDVGDIYTAYSGEDGIEQAVAHMPDVIITDIRMGEVSGLNMIEALNQRGCHSHFILLSGYAEFEYAKKAIALGVDEYLTKPIEEEELIKAWNKIIAKIKEEKARAEGSHQSESALSPFESYRESLSSADIPYGIITDGDVGELELALDQGIFEQCERIAERVFSRLSDGSYGYEESRNASLRLVEYGFSRMSRIVDIDSALGKQYISRLESIDRLKNTDRLRIWVMDAYDILIKTGSATLDGDRTDIITLAKEYIKANYNRNISLQDISSNLNINATYFSELFKKRTGITYKNYLTLVRVHQARKLLIETDMKIYEICEAVGYADVNNLNRVFEKEYGMKPNEYRKQKSNLL